MKHANIAIFIPHAGCPHQCSFCNQKSISGATIQPTDQDVIDTIESALTNPKLSPQKSEIAFFGGSFTAIDRDYMLSLLKVAYPYVNNGRFYGIRISTRPDAINDEILSLLKQYGVRSIELGAQSMVDNVLRLNERGHDAQCIRDASNLIKSYGFSLGLQMMTGLYGDNDDGALYTAEQFIELKPDTVRIYPTIVMDNTLLGELYRSGKYIPQSLDDAVSLCARLLNMFEQSGINVIRVGLHAQESLQNGMLCGPYHPAFRELCQSRIMLCQIIDDLTKHGILSGNITICINPSDVSKMLGQKRSNITKLSQMGYQCSIKQDESCPKGCPKLII